MPASKRISNLVDKDEDSVDRFEQIWAPWRLSYIQSNQKDPAEAAKDLKLLPGADPNCFLCQAVADDDDRSRAVLTRGKTGISLLNRYPYNNGHLLVAPRRHVADLADLAGEEHLEIMQSITRLVGVVGATLNAEGFNVGLNLGHAAGAGLPGHLHWHIVPRWSGDTNFMPSVAGVKVIPQSLEALWEVLSDRLGP